MPSMQAIRQQQVAVGVAWHHHREMVVDAFFQAVEHRLLPAVVRRLAADDVPEPERSAA